MSKRKIADCVNIRVKTGDFQHIEIVKYAEEEIEYNNDQERIEKEDALTASLVESIMRSLHSIPERIGRGKAEVIEVEQAISKAIPAWLANDPVPNIANQAKKVFNTISDRQKADKDKALATEKAVLPEEDGRLIKTTKVITDTEMDIVKAGDVVTEEQVAAEDSDDLFEVDPLPAPITLKTVETVETKEVKKDQALDGFGDWFGDK